MMSAKPKEEKWLNRLPYRAIVLILMGVVIAATLVYATGIAFNIYLTPAQVLVTVAWMLVYVVIHYLLGDEPQAKARP